MQIDLDEYPLFAVGTSYGYQGFQDLFRLHDGKSERSDYLMMSD